MARQSKGQDSERARKTIYVSGFDPKRTTKPLLHELFNQGGPVKDVTLFDTHAYVLFQHEESVPYCLALYKDIELFGEKLRISPKFRTKDTYCYLNHMLDIRSALKEQYMRIPPPNLPPKTRVNIRRSHTRRSKVRHMSG